MNTNEQEKLENNLNNPTNGQIFIHKDYKTEERKGFYLKPLDALQFEYINDPLSEIQNCTSVIIKQEPEYLEFISGCERNIAYHIFGKTSEGKKYLFKCAENTGCLNRWLCPTALRQLQINFFHISSNNESVEPKIYANFLKPFKCPCFCLGRPEIFLTLNDKNEKIGKILEPFSGCSSLYEIYDDKEQMKYMVRAKCCQCGLLCANSIFGRMGEAIFNIIDPESKEQIGIICKKSPVMTDGLNENEDYLINFPEKASTNDKLLLITLGLMIDYQYFELDPSKL